MSFYVILFSIAKDDTERKQKKENLKVKKLKKKKVET